MSRTEAVYLKSLGFRILGIFVWFKVYSSTNRYQAPWVFFEQRGQLRALMEVCQDRPHML